MQNPSNIPPLGPVYTPACEIRIVINHPITRTGATANFGGGLMTSLTVNSGGDVNFSGNVSVNNVGAPAFLFQINDGGRFSADGTLSLQAGAVFNVANTSGLNPFSYVEVSNLTFLNVGSGQAVTVGPNTVFKVNNQTRLQGGGALNIQGEFLTNTFNSTNSGGNQVNISGDGSIKTTGNMVIDGYPITMSGNAAVLVEGSLNITNSGSSAINLNGPSTNFNVLNFGSSIATGKTPSGTCFHIPEYGPPNNCSSFLCLEIVEIPVSADIVERVYIFRCNANWIIPNNTGTQEILDDAEVLIVAGGGGGGRGTSAGGGGAGGVLYIPSLTLVPGSPVSVEVGAGGLGATNVNTRGNNGGNSTFLSNTANGGGGGGSTGVGARSGNNGGSGGGGAFQAGNGGGSGNQGNGGGNGNNTTPPGRNFGGGGGGGGSQGLFGPDGSASTGARGGIGVEFTISGSPIIYAAGGGGTATGPGTSQGAGGSLGIGGAANGAGILRNGRINTGSGGGATSSGTTGGNGALGIVIVRQSFRILPVEFISFSAEFLEENRKVQLTWETGKEWNNSHFEIQRSVDYAKNWENIGLVNGAGWSDIPSGYFFTDEKLPLAGGLVYYRLRQVDFDGQFSFSKTISVKFPAVLNMGNSWRVFPNPVKEGRIFLESLSPHQEGGDKIETMLVAVSGQVLGSFQGNLIEITDWLNGIIGQANPGMYILEITHLRNSEYLKIVKR
ncbi:T9SS type A sorting domain-containing protein [Cognataquiflexum rubidum]|uniref:T9SS type A sorting domain-containing protein n=1 Tax=Cognataquiflexum rubidum TaxID=2922273 RepID=UPI001F12B0FA|nr:T9SS type A sorting domain-containing protein [Cognataquiflexum rubidum]MCH6232698.1 T9SS type A sorting domain-containing protein [Cognataquiflexum rubidum]